MRPYKPYVPQTPGEVVDLLGSMMLGAPTFVDRTGYFPGQNLDTEFQALNGGLDAIRAKIGEEGYRTLTDLAARARALFEADPDKTTSDTFAGRKLIDEMQQMLMRRRRG